METSPGVHADPTKTRSEGTTVWGPQTGGWQAGLRTAVLYSICLTGCFHEKMVTSMDEINTAIRVIAIQT